MNTTPEHDEPGDTVERKESQVSQTASDYIDEQLGLEADAREILPYKFDSCSQPLGALRQNVFACLTCSPPPASAAQVYTPAGICYSCSISCHGEHNLVELFARRNFVCDCGTTRMPSTSSCTLRTDPVSGVKGVHSQEAAVKNHYNHNFQNLFCGCGEEYDAHKEKGTMYQCLGMGSVETGGCGEDWWHPECLLGLPRDWNRSGKDQTIPEQLVGGDAEDEAGEEEATPPGFPAEDDFESLICYKCVASNPWIKAYAGTPGFLPPVFKKDSGSLDLQSNHQNRPRNLKRKASSDEDEDSEISTTKRPREAKEDESAPPMAATGGKVDANAPVHKHDALPPAPEGTLSLFLKEDFREHICHCPKCYPNLLPHAQLVEEEETYQPSISDSEASDAGPGSGTRSHGTGSLLERGEAALSGVDRVRAIEGIMVYQTLKDKVKDFLRPYADSGKPVGAEEIKAYFEKLRGDDAAIKEAGSRPRATKEDDEKGGNNSKEQSGY